MDVLLVVEDTACLVRGRSERWGERCFRSEMSPPETPDTRANFATRACGLQPRELAVVPETAKEVRRPVRSPRWRRSDGSAERRPDGEADEEVEDDDEEDDDGDAGAACRAERRGRGEEESSEEVDVDETVHRLHDDEFPESRVRCGDERVTERLGGE